MPDPREECAAELPADFGPMHGADGHARITGPCGDTMEYWVRVREGRIVAVTYTTDGCWSSISAGPAAARLAEGRSTANAAQVQQSDVLALLGGLPKGTEHCALLAANTLKAAVADWRSKES